MSKRVEELTDEEYRRRVRRSNIRDIILIILLEVGWVIFLFWFHDP